MKDGKIISGTKFRNMARRIFKLQQNTEFNDIQMQEVLGMSGGGMRALRHQKYVRLSTAQRYANALGISVDELCSKPEATDVEPEAASIVEKFVQAVTTEKRELSDNDKEIFESMIALMDKITDYMTGQNPDRKEKAI